MPTVSLQKIDRNSECVNLNVTNLDPKATILNYKLNAYLKYIYILFSTFPLVTHSPA